MKNLLSVTLLGMLLAACAPSTPQARIAREPQKFDSLSAKHRELVQQGRIERGMPPDAVYLAWGSPSRTFQGSKNGRMTARWDYAGSRPVHFNSFNGFYGRRFGPCGGRGYYGTAWGPEVAYIPYRIGSVWFVDNRVDAWERAR